MAKIINAVSDFFRPLNGAQKTLFGLMSAGVVILVGLLFYWALQPSYAVLFRSLSADSAQTIVEELKSSGVSYQLDDNGHTIRVPRDEVYDLRLKFAADGAAGDNYKGYELFDQNALGMTDFMQRVNKKRAIEGELARTINDLSQVESSRIHIVLPERSPFQDSEVKPSASVVLNMKPSQSLSEQQIEGIAALIAGSVEKLNSKEVVILDQNGNQISNNTVESDLAAAGSEQMKIRQLTEKYLSHKGQTMLDRVVGPGNSIVRVSTEHNFNKITRESNTIDPESRTIISEENRNLQNTNRTQKGQAAATQQNNATTTANQQNQSKVEVKNYEVSKTNEYLENSVGGITHISSSVLLNYKKKVTKTNDGQTKTTYVPYSDKELAEIKGVIHSALGLQNKRGDELTITQVKFQDPYSLSPQGGGFFDSFSPYQMIRWVLMLIVAGVIAFLMYRTSKNITAGGFNVNQLLGSGASAGSQPYLEGREKENEEEDIYAKKLSEKARKQLNSASDESSNIDQFIENNTSQAATLLRTLMKQEQL